jgi:hypothetical protein
MMLAIVERVEPRHARLVGGIVNSTLQVSAAVGIAVLGGLFYTVISAHAVPATVARLFSHPCRDCHLPCRRCFARRWFRAAQAARRNEQVS